MQYPNQADLMRRARKRKKLTTRGMAAELGVTNAFIAHIEAGKRSIPYEVMDLFCEITGYSLTTVKRAAVKDYAHRFDQHLDERG
jgi:transcriptional regulator with XRE-family HTH domain